MTKQRKVAAVETMELELPEWAEDSEASDF